MDRRPFTQRSKSFKSKRLTSSRPSKKKQVKPLKILFIFEKLVKIGLTLSVIFVPYVLWSSGYIHRKGTELQDWSRQKISQQGFKVDDIILEGRELTSQKSILEALKISQGDSIFLNSLDQLRQSLEKLPWVRSALIQRRLPDILYIKIFEHRPIALWQNQGKIYLVDNQGNIFENKAYTSFKNLLILTGLEAPKQAGDFIKTLSKFPQIFQKVTGAIFISRRRWDVILEHKLRLKLAEFDMKESLNTFVRLAQEHKLEEKEIVGIDLRFKDRVYFQISPEALEKQKKVGKNNL